MPNKNSAIQGIMMKFALWNTLIKNFDHVVTQDRSSAFLICMPYLCYLVPPSLEFVKGSVLDVSYETETTCTWQWPLYWMKWILRRVWWLLVIWQSLTCYFPKKTVDGWYVWKQCFFSANASLWMIHPTGEHWRVQLPSSLADNTAVYTTFIDVLFDIPSRELTRIPI